MPTYAVDSITTCSTRYVHFLTYLVKAVAPSPRLISYIKDIEKLVSPAQHLPADKPGVITGGYGETDPSLVIHEGMEIPEPLAIEWLTKRLADIFSHIEKHVTVPITQGQYDALASFCYNLGIGSLLRSSLLRYLNAGRYDKASDEFPKWNQAAGQVLDGLTKRRLVEQSWFNEHLS